MRQILVSSLGPIDRHPPGKDVTGIYSGEILKRLLEEGYLEESLPPKPASVRKARKDKSDAN